MKKIVALLFAVGFLFLHNAYSVTCFYCTKKIEKHEPIEKIYKKDLGISFTFTFHKKCPDACNKSIKRILQDFYINEQIKQYIREQSTSVKTQ